MNVADSTPMSNPSSDPAETAEQLCQRIDQLTQSLKEGVQEAAKSGTSFDSVEQQIHKTVFAIGQQAVGLFISLQGDGDLGETLLVEDVGTLRRNPEKSSTTIRSIFGTHRFEQYTYAPGPKKAIVVRPISARMSLPKGRWSYLLQHWTQMLAVDSAYQQAMDNLHVILGGGKLSVDTAEQMNHQMGTAAGKYLDELPEPSPESEAKYLVATADCKGVPLVKDDAAKVAAFETAKKNPGNRRMATVASVYTVDPHIRTAEEIADALFRDECEAHQVNAKRPEPANKNTTAHMPELADDGDGKDVQISGIHVAMAWTIGQIEQRRRAGQVLIALMDGQESLWETMKLHVSFGVRTVPILDIIHALVYVWEAAGLFEKDDGRRRAFTRERLLRILRGEVKCVIKGLRRLGTTSGLKGDAAKDLSRICGYLEKNAHRMRYDEYLRRGYPIASGVIEGACRHLVKDRMERSGMRWTLEGARSMLHLRAAFQSDHWETFLQHRMEHETAQIHPHRDLLNDYQPITLAC